MKSALSKNLIIILKEKNGPSDLNLDLDALNSCGLVTLNFVITFFFSNRVMHVIQHILECMSHDARCHRENGTSHV